MKTPKNERKQNESTQKESTSGKKLKQARLPFQILSTPPVGGGAAGAATKDKAADKDVSEIRKRKLNYDKDEEVTSNQTTKRMSTAKTANACSLDKKKTQQSKEIVEITDSDDEASVSCSKENMTLSTITARIFKQNHFDSEQETDMQVDDVELVETTDVDEEKMVKPIKAIDNNAKSTSKGSAKDKKYVVETKVEQPKVLIKLPKNKRRKSTVQMVDETVVDDDIETECDVSQSVKRPKLEENLVNDKNEKTAIKMNEKENLRQSVEANTTSKSVQLKTQNDEIVTPRSNKKVLKNQEIVTKSSEKGQKEKVHVQLNENANPQNNSKIQVELENSPKNMSATTEDDTTIESDANKSKVQEINSTSTDEETDADAETETTNQKEPVKMEQKNRNKHDTTPKITNESSTSQKLNKKNLTPKQQKLMEQRLKAREEKERKIQEERLLKQREKEERELARKRERDEKEQKRREREEIEEQKRKEREEKEEQKRKEREEKEEQKRKEREEKERKRLADLEVKNEEKRKRNEAKEEELRKKEDERKRKEQEKEEAELKNKKAAMAFKQFFSRPATSDNQNMGEQQERHDENIQLAFRPFQIKGAMKLAPTVRKQLTYKALTTLDEVMAKNLIIDEEQLYIKQLKTGLIKPHKWLKPVDDDDDAPKNENDSKSGKAADDDVIFVEDELERAGQAIVEEPVVPVERLRVKFFKFAKNRRPPYYGTWRKKSQIITPRRPFSMDTKFFDYDVDSDDEWEEEEPGESLDGSDDEKEKESEDDDYEVDNEWFVPHGHLSDEEMQGADGDLGVCNDREAQKAKLQVLQQEFAQEMKKKTEKIKPRLIGCIWVDENGNQPDLCPKIIWDTLNTRAILCVETPILEEIESASTTTNSAANEQTNEKQQASESLKLNPIKFNEDMLKQLVKLVHGNTHSKNFIIKEFIAYIEANEESVRNGDFKGPLKSDVRERIYECAQWQVVEQQKQQQDPTAENAEKNKNKKNKKKLCWVVSPDKLKELEMENLDLNNIWQYTLQPRERNLSKPKTTNETTTTTGQGEDLNEQRDAATVVDQQQPQQQPDTASTSKAKSKSDIKMFTKVLTATEKGQLLQKSKEQLLSTPTSKAASTGNTTTPSSSTSSNLRKTPSNKNANTTTNNTNTNKTPIVKKRVPLLMSVARGQTISTPDKNARISSFLKTLNDSKQKLNGTQASAAPTPMEVDEVIVLE